MEPGSADRDNATHAGRDITGLLVVGHSREPFFVHTDLKLRTAHKGAPYVTPGAHAHQFQ